MKGHLPPGIAMVNSEDLKEWQMDIQVLDNNPLYENETYRLKFTFSDKYPIGTQILNTPGVDDQQSPNILPSQNLPRSSSSIAMNRVTHPVRSRSILTYTAMGSSVSIF